MPRVIFPLDSSKKFEDQEKLGHNRWHPEIPPVATVKPGDSFRVHCREWFDGAIVNDDSADDILNAPLLTVHKLSGLFAVEGARPGDLLIVDILDVGPIPQEDSGPLAGQGWGYTGIFARNNGGGFLTEQFPDAYKAITWAGGIGNLYSIPGFEMTDASHTTVDVGRSRLALEDSSSRTSGQSACCKCSQQGHWIIRGTA
jgi:formamidase